MNHSPWKEETCVADGLGVRYYPWVRSQCPDVALLERQRIPATPAIRVLAGKTGQPACRYRRYNP
jgi:hypothetical protein